MRCVQTSAAFVALTLALSAGACKKDSGDSAGSQPESQGPATNPASPGGDTGSAGSSEDAIGGTLDVAVLSVGQLAITALTDDELGQASPSELESLQYRFSSIQICRDLKTNGTGYDHPTDCLEIYAGEQGSGSDSYDQFGYEEAKADTTHYIDLMDKTSLAKLSSQLKLKATDAHDYNYGLVNWYQPIKVKASVALKLAGTTTTTIYTKDGPMVTEIIGNDNFHKFTTRVGDITTAPADVAIVRHNNGGSWFKFAKPFTITEGDIKNKTNFKLDLTFNPDGIVKGGKTGAGGGQIAGVTAASFPDIGLDHPAYPAEWYSIGVPMLALTPIAHSAEDKVVKESYLVHVDTTAEKFDIRVELYSLDSDKTKSIYGVGLQTLVTAASVKSAPEMYAPFTIEEKESGEIVMQTYQKKSIFGAFKRLDKKGDTGTLQLNTGDGLVCLSDDGNACFTDKTYTHAYDLTYELVNTTEL